MQFSKKVSLFHFNENGKYNCSQMKKKRRKKHEQICHIQNRNKISAILIIDHLSKP